MAYEETRELAMIRVLNPDPNGSKITCQLANYLVNATLVRSTIQHVENSVYELNSAIKTIEKGIAENEFLIEFARSLNGRHKGDKLPYQVGYAANVVVLVEHEVNEEFGLLRYHGQDQSGDPVFGETNDELVTLVIDSPQEIPLDYDPRLVVKFGAYNEDLEKLKRWAEREVSNRQQLVDILREEYNINHD